MDPEESGNLKFPATVMIIETLGEDATDADLYKAGYNMFEMEIHSLDDIPEGHEIHGICDDEEEGEEQLIPISEAIVGVPLRMVEKLALFPRKESR